jgi:DNA-directed RNA polymerase subunit M/transcription elongation factor TFIIS
MTESRIVATNKLLNLFSQYDIDELYIKDLEIGIYNWTIDYSNKNNIIKNWENNRFTSLYFEKCRSIISVINKDINKIISNLKDKTYLPHEIPFMKPEDIHPDLWKDIIEIYTKIYENSYENAAVAMTDLFRCGKCKGNKCSYYELQSRKSDESTTIHVKCLICGFGWRIG